MYEIERVLDIAPGRQSPDSVVVLEQELQRCLEKYEQRAAISSGTFVELKVNDVTSPSIKPVEVITDVLNEVRCCAVKSSSNAIYTNKLIY